MEKPITVLINDTKNAIISILNESNLHPILMEQIMNEIHTEVTNVLNQTIKKEKEEYVRLTYGLSKENNLIVMGMVKHCSDYQIGFGGTMGTELFSTLPFHNREQLIESFVATAHNSISKDEIFVHSFRQANKSAERQNHNAGDGTPPNCQSSTPISFHYQT